MNQEVTNLAKILAKYLNNECDNSEKEILQAWLKDSEKNQKVLDNLMDKRKLQDDLIQYNRFDKEAAWEKLASRFEESKPNVLQINYKRFLFVASVLLVLFSVSFLYFNSVPS